MNTIKLAGLGLAVAITGCVASPAGDPIAGPDVESADVGTAQEALSAASVPTRHAYVGYNNRIGVTDDFALAYAQFELIAGARVAISVQGASDGVGFKLYRVTPAGNLSLLRTVDGPTGVAKTTLKNSKGGSYVVETTSNLHPDSLELSVDCLSADGRCTPLRQPAEMCGGIAAFNCDAGLYCATAVTTCGRWDQSGTCAVKPDVCTRIYAPVCGCDGKTYGNACEAASAGASIASRGACSTAN
jgi:Kazal-type serine protease inhibitor domain